MTEVACCVCLIEYPSWKVNNPRYCCSALTCQDCAKVLNKCPQCRHQSPTESGLELESGPEILIDTPTFKCTLTKEEGEDDVEFFAYLEIEHFKDGKLHHDNMPAGLTYRENGTISCERWFKNGQFHREDDKPVVIVYHENGCVKKESWYKDNVLGRDGDKPAEIYYFSNGNTKIKTWYKDGLVHRDNDMPAEITYSADGSICCEQWFKNSGRHRHEKPSHVCYGWDGMIEMVEFYEDDLPRENSKGPFRIINKPDGTVERHFS